MAIYLDNSATTKPYSEVADEVLKALTVDFENPSSAYRRGLDIEKKIKAIRKKIASTIKAEPSEIIFTSGGTECNNTLIRSAAHHFKHRKNHIITSRIEHPSVLNTFYELEKEGFEITFLDVDSSGNINIEDLKNALTEKTSLVSIMFVNNEIGTISNVKEIAETIKNFDESIIYHVDAVQAYGKIDFSVKELKMDCMSVSSHKLHGPKGCGFMYIRKKMPFIPLMAGGGQEFSMRSGTENVPGIYGFGKAVELLFDGLDKKIEKMDLYKKTLQKKITENISGVSVNSPDDGVCHILNVSFEGIRGEVLLHFLENDEIYVSTGSACSSKKKGSHVLGAIGLDDRKVDGAIRFSISEMNEMEEIDIVVDKIKKYVSQIRKISGYRER